MKPNILFISPIRQYDGWGQASKDYARALATVSNLTIRNIYLSNQREKKLPQDLQILEDNKLDNYDIVIQKTLPNLYYYDGRFKQNIGMTVFETELNHHSWFNNMNLMDKILVPSYGEERWLKTKLKNKVYNVSEALDLSITDKKYESMNPVLSNPNTFKFLFIGESNPRKGIKELIEAYFGEFSINDNVLLILKTSNNIINDIEQIKKSMRRFVADTKYPSIFFIADRLSNEQIYSLHQDSNVFVMPSFGEAFNRPAAMSVAFGKPVIGTDNTGIANYLFPDIGWLIKSTKEQVFCQQPPLNEIYTAKETWHVPNVLSLRECMREAYEDKNLYKTKCNNIIKSQVKENFSYEYIGKKILKALED